MTTVNMLDAKTNLSKLVDAVERGAETEIVIARNGRPAARLVPLEHKVRKPVRLGVAKGEFEPPPFPDGMDEEVAALFLGDES